MHTVKELRIPFTWEDRHPVLLDRLLYVPSFYAKHAEWEPVLWSDPRIFGNNNPVVVEYCSGNGQWICARAQQNPNQNFVAVEKKFDRCRKIWARVHREQLNNVYVFCAEAAVATVHYMPKGSVAEVFVNFPDPWPKLRHAKHRLIRPEFLFEVAGAMMPCGRATFVTDDTEYAMHMIAVCTECAAWEFILPPPHYTLNAPGHGSSYFLDLWVSKGRSIYFIPVKKRE